MRRYSNFVNNPAADFIFAAFIFEYVDINIAIANIKKWLIEEEADLRAIAILNGDYK